MKEIIFIIIILSIILSCSNQNNKDKIYLEINSDVNGQTFLNGNTISEEYSPKGGFIEIVPSNHQFWKDVRLFQNEKEFIAKHFFIGEETTYLYDSLINGEYQLKFISHFNDEVEESVNLKGRLKKQFPDKLSKYYEEIKFDEYTIGSINTKDTFQILYQYFACFSFSHHLIEFIFDESNTKVRVADWSDDWKEVELESPIDTLNKLINEGKEFNGIRKCSNYAYYTFRKKSENKISIVEDGSCEWKGINMILKI